MKTVYVSKNSEKGKLFYEDSLKRFSKQFKDIKEIKILYVNTNNKVFAAQWIDKNNVINFNGGYAVDAVKEVIFKD